MADLETYALKENTRNEDILNALRHVTTPAYQTAIPEATRENIHEVVQNLMSHTVHKNEFINALVNQIGMIVARNLSFSNPLAPFKMGMLEYGDTYEEVQIGRAQAYVYDHDRDALEKALFGREAIDVRSAFHQINRENYYKVTISDVALRRAFQSPTGLSSFIAKLMEAPLVSDQVDEFLLMASLFSEYEQAGGFYKIQIPSVSSADSNEAEAKFALRAIRSMAGTLTFPSRLYNAAHMEVTAQTDDLWLFATPEFMAAVDVEALAGAFNTERAQIPSRTMVIPPERFNIPGCEAILTTKDFFVVMDTLMEARTQPNPLGLYDNHFWHHHQIISTSPFVPAIMFTTAAGDTSTPFDPPVASVDLTAEDRYGDTVTDVKRGELYDLNAVVTTNPTGGSKTGADIKITSAHGEFTYISNANVLHVGLDERAETLTIKATALGDSTKADTLELTVSGEGARFWPKPGVVADA